MAGRKQQAKTKKPPARVAESRARPSARGRASVARPSAGRSRGSSAPAKNTIDRLHQVAVTAKHLDESVAFYRDVVGLKFIARFDPPGLAFFNLGGGARLMLSATASEATLYFLVDNLKAAYAEFQKRGVHFLQPPAMIHRDEAGQFGKKGNEEWMAFFRDPSNNMLALVQRR
jgi:catechol 2,3-dioxygenase-like lactoylglutathione lyase family enzyme